MLDRLTHRAHIINFNWESYRLKETLKGKKKKKEPEVPPDVDLTVARAPEL